MEEVIGSIPIRSTNRSFSYSYVFGPLVWVFEGL